jgi:ABC-type sugar transport system substrate-binding protein
VVEKMRRQSRLESVVIGVCLLTILGLSFFYLYLRSTFRGEAPQTGDGAHILMLLPSLEDDESTDFHAMAKDIAEQYGLRVEIMTQATVDGQREMLSIVPMTDVDAVLLWAVSNLDEDYQQELADCRAAGIPVAIVEHDFEDKSLRDSFIGSGMNSELMVINQTLWDIRKGSPVIIGSYSHAGEGELYELLVMLQEENQNFDPSQIRNERLRMFVENHPNSYYANTYIQVRADAGGTAALNISLIRTLLRQEPAGLFFSLSEPLTAAMAMAADNGALAAHAPDILIGYGGEEELGAYIEPGIINELIVPDVLYSSMIGLRYLNDVLRDFYVPSTLDSGVKLISREELADESH